MCIPYLAHFSSNDLRINFKSSFLSDVKFGNYKDFCFSLKRYGFFTCFNTQPSFNPSVVLVMLTEMLVKLVSYPLPPKLLLCTVFWLSQASFLFPRILCISRMINAFPMLNAAKMYECSRLLGSCILPLLLLLVRHESP